ncbi:MAG TPA: cobalamin-binding protein [Thermomicrobiaceae bacterium]|nr:cobalamin-binding protein [Thermomicrobiaceae bacterium]
MKIVSLLPSTTEICFAIGLSEQLVAVTHECDYPPAAASLAHATRNVLPPGITDSAEIDRLVTERVLAGQSIYELDLPLLERLAPDLILTQALCEVCAVAYEDVVSIAHRLPGPPDVASIEPRSLEEILESILTVGRLAGRAERADTVVAALRGRVALVEDRVGAIAIRPRVVCLEWLDPPMVAGHWVPEMVEAAGGQDVLGRAGEPAFRVHWQDVCAAAPDVVVLMPCGYGLDATLREVERLLAGPAGWPPADEVAAVPGWRVYAVDGSGYFNRPGPRVVDGIEILAGILHPEVLAGAGPPDTARAVALRAAGPVR